MCTKLALGFLNLEKSIASQNDSLEQLGQQLFRKNEKNTFGDEIPTKFTKALMFQCLSPREKHDLFDDMKMRRTRVLYRKFNTIRSKLIDMMNYVEEVTTLVLQDCLILQSKELQSDIKTISMNALKGFAVLYGSVSDLTDLVTMYQHTQGLKKKVTLERKIYENYTLLN